MKELAYLNKYLLAYKGYLLWGTFFIAISNLLVIMPAWLVREAIDVVSEHLRLYKALSGLPSAQRYGPLIGGLFFYGVLILALSLVRGIFLFLMRQTIIVMSRHIEYDLKNELYTHYQFLSMTFFSSARTGDLLARLSEDISRVRMYLGPAIMYAISLSTLLLILIPVMFSVNVKLSLFALMPLPLLSLSIYYVNTLINKKSERIQAQISRLSNFTQESFSGIRVIKSFARELAFSLRFKQEGLRYKDRSMSLVFVESLFFPLMVFLIGMSILLTVYMGSKEVLLGHVTVGHVAEFLLYVTMLTWPVTSLGWLSSLVQRAAASQGRINALLADKSQLDSGTLPLATHAHSLRFKGVRFYYPNKPSLNVLEDLSFSLSHGESLAVIGRIGSGKTTLLQLICRLYDPIEGRIALDGHNLSSYKLSDLRAQIGYVPQDSFLFSDTLAANIAFGKEKATQEEIMEVVRRASLEETIASFPKGLDTMVGERGVMLSGGQKQRVALARALIRRPSLLLLDDCLSALDTQTEHQVLDSLTQHIKQAMTFIVTHRVSSAKLADKILVLDQGRLADLGTHNELLVRNAYYKDFYQKGQHTE